jgi:hypothetical protein
LENFSSLCFITEDMDDAQMIVDPFTPLALVLNKTLMTSGARSPGADATPRRYRPPTEVTRWGGAWLACKVYLYRGLLQLNCKYFITTRISWKTWRKTW